MQEYLKLLQFIMDNGEMQETRTGVRCKSIFGWQSRYNLCDGFPVVTTKKVDFEAIKAELFFFLKASTNVNDLPEKYRFIWNAWAKEDGDLGKIYGAQWCNWSDYTHSDNTGDYVKAEPINQIQNAINRLKKNPMDRQIIVSAWNVAEIPKMALPACHIIFQLKGYPPFLDLMMMQRSLDTPVGCPYNIASYALLLSMIAKEVGLIPRYFIHSVGDAHIYENQIEGVIKQLQRIPKELPTLKLKDGVGFWDFKAEDCELIGYEHHPYIKYPVAV